MSRVANGSTQAETLEWSMKLFLLLALLGLAPACSGDESDVGGQGEEVERRGAASLTAPRFQLHPAAMIIGEAADGPSLEVLHSVRAALRLRNGSLVIADQGSNEIRYFGPAGDPLGRSGGRGGGPGEFQALDGIAEVDSSRVVAWDPVARRVSIFGATPQFLESRPVDGLTGFLPRLLGVFGGGLIAFREDWNPGVAGQLQGELEERFIVVLARPRGTILDTLGPFPGTQSYVLEHEGARSIRPIPFGRVEQVAVGGGFLVVGNDRDGTLTYYTREGTVAHEVQTGLPARPVRPADEREFARDHLAAASGRALAVRRRFLEVAPFAATRPAFLDLFVDRLGRAWVKTASTAAAERWLIVDPGAGILGSMETEARAEPLDAASDYVVLRTRGPLDVEIIAIHPLSLPSSR